MLDLAHGDAGATSCSFWYRRRLGHGRGLRPGLSLEDLRLLTTQLLLAGAPIAPSNGIRGALSELKGGGLACAAAPAQVIGLLLSDVVGDDPASIASGPRCCRLTLPPGATHARAARPVVLCPADDP